MAKKRIDILFCVSCESDFKLTYAEEEVSRYPTLCPFCGEEIDFDKQDDADDDGLN